MKCRENFENRDAYSCILTVFKTVFETAVRKTVHDWGRLTFPGDCCILTLFNRIFWNCRENCENKDDTLCILTLFDTICRPPEEVLKAMYQNGAFWRYLIRYFGLKRKVWKQSIYMVHSDIYVRLLIATSMTPFNLYCNFRRLIISNKNVLQHVSKFCNGEYGHLSTNVDDIYLLTKFRIFETFLLLNVIILSNKDVKTIRFV